MADYLPQNDSQLSTWVNRFASYLSIHFADFGLTLESLAQLQADQPEWETALTAHVNAQANARSACATKNAKRGDLVSAIRTLAKLINAHPGVTDAQLEALGLKPKTSDVYVATTLSTSDDKPHAIIDGSGRLQHVLRLQNQTPTGVSKARPASAAGCEIWRKIGDAPLGPNDMQLVATAMRNQFVVQFDEQDGGKQAHYMLRWVTAKGDAGKWSETESVTIAA